MPERAGLSGRSGFLTIRAILPLKPRPFNLSGSNSPPLDELVARPHVLQNLPHLAEGTVIISTSPVHQASGRGPQPLSGSLVRFASSVTTRERTRSPRSARKAWIARARTGTRNLDGSAETRPRLRAGKVASGRRSRLRMNCGRSPGPTPFLLPARPAGLLIGRLHRNPYDTRLLRHGRKGTSEF